MKELTKKNEASVLVIYGRRRVGTAGLIEQFFHGRNALKFEGIQPIKIKKDVEDKIALFINHNPKYKNYTFEKALITTEGTQESLTAESFLMIYSILYIGTDLINES